MSKLRILVPDNLHINQKNFASFFGFVEEQGAEVHFCTERQDLIAAYGNYIGNILISGKVQILQKMGAEELESLRIDGLRLFKVCKAELLSVLLPKDEWQTEHLPDSESGIFRKAWRFNKEVLIANMAMAWDWIEYWREKLGSLPVFTHACIFSGSLIYQRTLIELLRLTPTRVLVMESAFTGDDYYCEEKYGPIANNSDIRFDTVYSSIKIPADPDIYDRERNKAFNKIILAKNRNVIQPSSYTKLRMPDGDKVVLIIGQVANDFSLIESGRSGIASIPFYKEMISALIERNIGVVFKAHPWEEQKTNVMRKMTFNSITSFVDALPGNKPSRIVVTDHYPINELLDTVDAVIGLNSQALLEAAFHGHKPIQFGGAFYGRRGFTHDRGFMEVEEVAEEISNGSLVSHLSIAEFVAFEKFCIKFFQGHLVNINKSGFMRLREIFRIEENIPLAKAVSNASVPQKLSSKPKEERHAHSPATQLTPLQRKKRKLMHDPYAFFRDARTPILRELRHLFKYGNARRLK